ncbi:hypothetical protein [Pyrobaculum sp.]|uniref:hypothetical protein n=1 Tax=Pyrobaculum sp. TaxID=2004705 RepID=UPI0031676F97
MDVVRLRLEGASISALGEEAVEEALRRIGYVQLSDLDVLRLLVAGASVEALARAMGTTPGVVRKRAREAYKALQAGRRQRPQHAEQASAQPPQAQPLAGLSGNEWVRILREKHT